MMRFYYLEYARFSATSAVTGGLVEEMNGIPIPADLLLENLTVWRSLKKKVLSPVKDFFREVKVFLKETVHEWSSDHVSRHAAALSYYTVFSLAPTLILVIAIFGLIWGREAAHNQIVTQIGSLVGTDSAQAIQDMLKSASRPISGIIATVTSGVMLLVGVVTVFQALQESLNEIWNVRLRKNRGFWKTAQNYLLSLSMVLAIGFILIVSLVFHVAVAAMTGFVDVWLPLPPGTLHILNFIVGFMVFTLFFALMYKFLPKVIIRWRDVWLGAAMTAFLINIGKLAIGFYLGKSEIASTYGASASVIIVLVWVYYSAQIFFFGAEMTQIYANRYGKELKPAADAEFIHELSSRPGQLSWGSLG